MKTTFSLAIAALGLICGTANAAPDLHVDDLAAKLQRQTAQLTYEIEHQFQFTRDYKHLLNDAVEMERTARHIHDVAHNFGSQRHIAADVKTLDRLFHHIEGLVGRMELQAQHNAHDYHYGYDYHARVIGVAQIRQLQFIMSGISDTLHHLQADLEPAPYRPRLRRGRPAVIAPQRPFINIRF